MDLVIGFLVLDGLLSTELYTTQEISSKVKSVHVVTSVITQSPTPNKNEFLIFFYQTTHFHYCRF